MCVCVCVCVYVCVCVCVCKNPIIDIEHYWANIAL